MNEIDIREARIEDCELILSFINQLASYEKLSHEVAADLAQIKQTLFADTRYANVLIAEYQGEAVGFALYFYNYSTFLAKPGIYLEDLFVVPAARGKKIGRALLVHLAKIAVTNNCGRFEWSVLDWNSPAIEFYKNIGAKPMLGWLGQRVDGQALVSLAELE